MAISYYEAAPSRTRSCSGSAPGLRWWSGAWLAPRRFARAENCGPKARMKQPSW